ncbi:Crp/Fnr family transcriptional regulator [Moheibacter stercoris]|uniref:CRP-like cAMP-binding protein n=1 Tax=Moheibacter stercoris TaxID=1628251 RepID=A0ABV2LT72_9FLAO
METKEQILQLILKENLFEKTLILKRNEIFKSIGSVDTNLYFLEEGSMKVSIIDDGEERIIRFGYRNNWLVAIDSFLTNLPSPFEFKALKRTKIHVLSKNQFEEILNSNSNFMQTWNDILQDLVLQQMEREIDLLTHSPKDRYERVLKRSPQLFQEISNHQIAKYLRMSPETLSRLKKS